jgi:hypothetical protein
VFSADFAVCSLAHFPLTPYTSLRGIICLNIINMSESSAVDSPTTSDDERCHEEASSQSQSQADGSTQGTTVAVAQTQADLSVEKVNSIQGSGKSNGAITFLIRWDSQVVDSTEYCYAVLSQEPCIEFYEEWTDVPEDRLREKDTVAHNPYYKHIDIGYWSLVEEVFLEARDHETLQDYSNETLK